MSRIQRLICRGTWCFDLLLLTVFMAVLFGLFLGSRPLSTPDEARYSEIPREMLVLHDFVTPHLNGIKYFEKPPLVYWIQAASIKLFDPWLGKIERSTSAAKFDKPPTMLSISEWVVRIPNALIALLGGLFLYAAGRLVFNRRTGLLSAVILTTSFLYFTLARMVTLDMSLSVFLSTSLLAFLVAVNSRLGLKRRYLCYLAYIFSALAVLTKGLVGIVFPAMIIGLWILLTQQWQVLKQIYLPSGILLFLAIVLPWHILVQQRNPEFFQFYFIEQQFLRYSTLIAQRYKPDWFFIPILFAGFLPWIVFLFQAVNVSFPKCWQQIREKSNQVFLLVWVSVIFIFFSLSHSKLIPYILPLFPAVALLTGDYLSRYSDRIGVKWGIILLPLIWLLLGGLGILWLFLDPLANLPKPGIPFLLAGYTVFLFVSLLAAVYYLRHRLEMAFSLLTVGSAISFIIFAIGIPQVDTRSIKPLVQVLKPLLHAHDKVVSYSNYYQDLPFYLNQRVMTVNFAGELSFGMQHQDTRGWMLSTADFGKLWHSSQHVFVITDKPLYVSFKKKNKPVYLIASTSHDVLLSNRPVQPQMLIQKAKQ
jgi:4-amino-4-deoxy-L-arabinose transferase-like glycosyltransferase